MLSWKELYSLIRKNFNNLLAHKSEAFPHTNISSISFNKEYTPEVHEEGLLHWNTDERCLEFGEMNGGSLQIGQEDRIYARNKQGTQIIEGQAVYIYGAAGTNVEMKLADADIYNEACCTIALATENIAINGLGRFTSRGFVRTLNTGAYDEGQILWLSATPGVLTNVEPVYPTNKVRVCVVSRANNINGEVYVDIDHDKRKFGNVLAGNYSGFEDDGTLVFNGTATCYDDMLNQLIGARLESPSSNIIQNNAEGSLTFQTDATTADYVTMSVQLSHRWKPGSTIYPHLHWFQAQNQTPNWLLQYRWQKQGQAKVTAWTSVKMNANAFTYVSGTLNQISGFPAITAPANYSVSDIVQCRVIRDTTNASTLFTGADPYTVDVDAVNFDIHIEVNKAGSRQEYVD